MFLPYQVTRAQKRGGGDMNYIYCGSNVKLAMNSSYSPVSEPPDGCPVQGVPSTPKEIPSSFQKLVMSTGQEITP